MRTTSEIRNKKELKYNWGYLLAWCLLGITLVLIIIMTFMRTPEEIVNKLITITNQLKYYFLVVHIVISLLLVTVIIWKKFRNQIFFIIMILLSLSSTIISSIYVVLPNIILFGIITVMVLIAFISKKLRFDLKNTTIIDLIVSSIGLLFGFWYLHWIEEPIALNALLYSPLGGVNCPTLVMLAAILILTKKPKPIMFQAYVGILTLYFGFFGMIMLDAYVDFVLILCGLYLIIRVVLNGVSIRRDSRKVVVDHQKS